MAVNDRRYQKTDRAIQESFMLLLTTKPLEKITVTALAQTADIERKTFYLHYSSLDELLAAIEERLEESLARELTAVTSVPELVRRLNSLMLADQDFYRGMLNTSPNLFLLDDLFLMLKKGLSGQVAALASDDYAADFLAAGIIQVYRQYLQKDRADLAQLTAALERLIRGILMAD